MGCTAWAQTQFSVTQLTTADGLANNTVRQVMQDSKGFVWMATSNGLSRYDGHAFLNFHPAMKQVAPFLKDQRVTGIQEDNHKRLWIDTRAGGFACFDLRKERFIRFDKAHIPEPEPKKSLPKEIVLPTADYHFVTDREGRYWIATATNGLYVYTPRNQKLEHFQSQLPTQALKNIMIDASGSLWIGTDQLGVIHIQPVNSQGVEWRYPFGQPDNCHIRMVQTIGNRVAVAGKDGSFAILSGDMNHVMASQKGPFTTYATMLDSQGQLWKGTKEAGLFVGKNHYSAEAGQLTANHIYALFQDSRQRIWVGTLGGGLLLATHDDHFKPYLQDNYGTLRARHIAEDGHGNLWVATSGGVVVINPQKPDQPLRTLNKENKALRSNEIRTIFADSHHNIYISETGIGLAIVSHHSLLTKHFDPTHGLINPMVQSIVEDRQGIIWMGTEQGLARFNPKDSTFAGYMLSTQLQGNVFNENAAALLADGRLAFGTERGVLLITPTRFSAHKTKATLHFTRMTVAGLSANQTPITYAKGVKLGSNQNTITLSVTTFNYAATRKELFSFMLQGYDNHWSLPSDNPEISYKNLPPGHYLLKAKVQNEDGTWSAGPTLAIDVAYPLWRSPGAIAVYIVVVILILVATRTLKSVITRLKKETEKVKETYSHEVNLRLNDNISAADQAFRNQLDSVMEEHLKDPDFSVDLCAQAMGMGRTTFFREVKRVTGYSPKEYLNAKRLKLAAELLTTTQLTVSQIAQQVGINDPLYLSRSFKAHYGCAPTIWRQNN